MWIKWAYLRVRKYRNDPSEDTMTHQAAAVTMACPDGLPEGSMSALLAWCAVLGGQLVIATDITYQGLFHKWMETAEL